MTQPRHLKTERTPSYAADAMETHVRVLLRSAERGRVETYLYLTDYRSLYVAELDEFTTEKIRSDTPAEVNLLPDYYEGMLADMWFRLLDIRDIVSENTPAKIAEQKQLRNKRYNDNEVSWFADRGDDHWGS
ncbi:hypothetical protein ACFL3B_05705 [Gemmatimonadota bacterium]